MHFRAMEQSDLPQAWMLSQQVKWPHRLEDWQQALRLGEGVVAEQEGQVVGTILGWRWGEAYATVGLVIVDEAYRGHGIGKQLLLAMLERMPGYTVRLNATEAGKALYEKYGFHVTGLVQQHQCAALGEIALVTPLAGQRLRPATAEDADLLTALDHRAHGLFRPAMVATLLNQGERVLLLQDAYGQPQGFAGLRRFGHGWLIGPVIAHDPQQARVLISTLMTDLAGEFVRVDSDPSLGLCSWLTGQGLQEVDNPTVMVRGTPWVPAPGTLQAFGLMSQAMG